MVNKSILHAIKKISKTKTQEKLYNRLAKGVGNLNKELVACEQLALAVYFDPPRIGIESLNFTISVTLGYIPTPNKRFLSKYLFTHINISCHPKRMKKCEPVLKLIQTCVDKI